MKMLVLGPLFAAIYGLFVFFNSGISDLVKLKIDGIQTVGTVTKVYSDYHKSFDYEIKVDGKSYQSGSFGRHNNIKVGDKVFAIYSKTNPDNIFSGDLEDALLNQLIVIAAVILIFPLVTVFILNQMFPYKKQDKSVT